MTFNELAGSSFGQTRLFTLGPIPPALCGMDTTLLREYMKIQLASTLPLSPVQLDPRHPEARRVVGMLHAIQGDTECRIPVYEFRHDENDAIQYQVAVSDCSAIGQDNCLVEGALNSNYDESDGVSELVWIDHNDRLSYKPYAFLVMDAMTRLADAWDGIVYRTPSGERLRESAFQATLQIVDACVSQKDGLWIMVNVSGESVSGSPVKSRAVHQLGWVPVT